MDIVIIALVAILFLAQMFLAIKQIKKGAPDGKILLIINIAVFVIWTPLTILRILTGYSGIRIAWFVVAAIYTIFTRWYTNNLRKTFK